MAVITTQGWHTTPDGGMLFTKTWKVRFSNKYLFIVRLSNSRQPATPASACVAFLHVFSDHCTRFTDLFQNLVTKLDYVALLN